MTPAQGLALLKSDITTGDTARAAGQWALAVQRYQLAGQAGADTVGPAIDAASKGDASTTSLTSQAWAMNGLLAALNSTDTATQDDANQASQFVQQLLSWYTAAVGYANSLAAPVAQGAAPVAKTETNIIVPTAKTLPSQMQHPAKTFLGVPLPVLTQPEMIVSGGGGLLGFALGSRFLGLLLGGPVGGVVGAYFGYVAAKRMKV